MTSIEISKDEFENFFVLITNYLQKPYVIAFVRDKRPKATQTAKQAQDISK